MRLLEHPPTVQILRDAIHTHARCDYVYAYPPRQAYRPFLSAARPATLVRESLAQVDAVNLYVHVPFCRQICAYCNLYAVASRGDDIHRRYIEAVSLEINMFAADLLGKRVHTVYIGGGTPSLLEPSLLSELLTRITERLRFSLDEVPEVAIEVAPDNATAEQLAAIRAAGFTRINLGVQSASTDELAMIGRAYASDTVSGGLEAAMAAGFSNVCVDLIYGLRGQSFDAWRRSVRTVIARYPQTICAYPLTLRIGTGFDRRGYRTVDDVDQYRKYDHVNATLRNAGYEQQTHVRWALPGEGGYLQKQYHWACEPVIGFGAGARSYLWALDTRNGYSLRRRRSALNDYLVRVENGESPMTDGFLMDHDERMRKAIILGLNHLDRGRFQAMYGTDPMDAFGKEIGGLITTGLVAEDASRLWLTELGVRHRDVAVQPLISRRVHELVREFTYAE